MHMDLEIAGLIVPFLTFLSMQRFSVSFGQRMASLSTSCGLASDGFLSEVPRDMF